MKRLLIIIAAFIFALVGALSLSACQREKPDVRPSPTVDPFAADRKALEEQSLVFGQKFFTYSRPNDPAYFDSIRPYMTPQFFNENKRLTEGESAALASAKPVTSTASDAEVSSISEREAEVLIRVQSQSANRAYGQTAVIKWIKTDGGWRVAAVGIEGTTTLGGE